VLSFDYAHELPSIQRLVKLSERAKWTVEGIDWNRPLSRIGGEYEQILEWYGIYRNPYVQFLSPKKREALARQFIAFDFSQILHGEQAALMLAGQLTSSVKDLDARLFAANQASDEARHVQAVRKIVERLGPIYPCGPILDKNLEALLECKLWPKQVLGLQLFLEARALLSFRQALLFVDDGVFKDAITLIERDEAHHCAFGVQYLRSGVDELGPEDRAELVAYAKYLNTSLWVMTEREEFRAAFEEVDLDYDECYASGVASFSMPALGVDKGEAVERMMTQFCRWFANAIKRVGLTEALEDEAPVEAGGLESDLVLPWIEQPRS
jgi:hypothetical protein